jgi:hypothetical protein
MLPRWSNHNPLWTIFIFVGNSCSSLVSLFLGVGVWYRRQVNFSMFVRLIRMVELRDIMVILVQTLQGALRPVWESVIYPTGLVVGGTGLGRERERISSLWVWWRARRAPREYFYEGFCMLWCVIVSDLVIFWCCDPSFYSPRGADVQGLGW